MTALGRARHTLGLGPEVEAEALAGAVAELRLDPKADPRDPRASADFADAVAKLEARAQEQAKPKEGDDRPDPKAQGADARAKLEAEVDAYVAGWVTGASEYGAEPTEEEVEAIRTDYLAEVQAREAKGAKP